MIREMKCPFCGGPTPGINHTDLDCVRSLKLRLSETKVLLKAERNRTAEAKRLMRRGGERLRDKLSAARVLASKTKRAMRAVVRERDHLRRKLARIAREAA